MRINALDQTSDVKRGVCVRALALQAAGVHRPAPTAPQAQLCCRAPEVSVAHGPGQSNALHRDADARADTICVFIYSQTLRSQHDGPRTISGAKSPSSSPRPNTPSSRSNTARPPGSRCCARFRWMRVLQDARRLRRACCCQAVIECVGQTFPSFKATIRSITTGSPLPEAVSQPVKTVVSYNIVQMLFLTLQLQKGLRELAKLGGVHQVRVPAGLAHNFAFPHCSSSRRIAQWLSPDHAIVFTLPLCRCFALSAFS